MPPPGILPRAVPHEQDRKRGRRDPEYVAVAIHACFDQRRDSAMRAQRMAKSDDARSRRFRQQQLGEGDSGEEPIFQEIGHHMHDRRRQTVECRPRVGLSTQHTDRDLGETAGGPNDFGMVEQRSRGGGRIC